MFYRDSNHIYRSRALADFDWLDHGFGTRHADPHPSPFTLKQIHSSLVLKAGEAPEGDALVSNLEGEAIAVRTADCVPLLMADPRTRTVAAVHAGWRGTVSRIAVCAVDRLAADYGVDPGDLVVAIGPAIGGCCYEVGPEVAEAFQPFFPERDDLTGRVRVDLAEANRRQLVSAGVNPDRIHLSGLCTCCQSADFHSYRRDKTKAGRMVSSIEILRRV
ncbi:MAG: peptidoglycan editing factor PgeF [Bryobacteraceae bacterium]|nr:peptidoglycan editing factor PgeF [Bryobacteraceae bacterium]